MKQTQGRKGCFFRGVAIIVEHSNEYDNVILLMDQRPRVDQLAQYRWHNRIFENAR